MAYDNDLAEKVRKAIAGERGWTERKMFGGLAFMKRGMMCCGIVDRWMMVRVGPDEYEKALARPHVRPMDFTGRPMRGMIYVLPEGIRNTAAIRKWIALAVNAPRPKKSTKKRAVPAK